MRPLELKVEVYTEHNRSGIFIPRSGVVLCFVLFTLFWRMLSPTIRSRSVHEGWRDKAFRVAHIVQRAHVRR
jgi:hypothetical protein